MILRLARRIGMEPRELRKALWLGGVLMAITSSYTLVKTARDSLFLSLLPATWLPWVYLLVGIVTLAVSVAFGLLTQRLSPLQSLAGTAIVSAAGLVAFATIFDTRVLWVPAGFYLWVNAYGLIVVSQFWAYTNSMSDPREAKRIFGIIGGGAILGGLIGGALAAWLGARVPLSWLAMGGAGLLVLAVPALALAVRHHDPKRAEDPVPTATGAPVPLSKVPYVRWLALATLCSVIVTGLLDYQLKIVVQQVYPTAPRLASFFGRFYVVMNVVALLLQLIGTRWLLQRLGAGSAAAVLPLGLAAGAGVTLALPGFMSVLGTRLWDQVLRFSLNKSAVELFYFPLEPGLRRRAKAVIEAGIERFGDALAGMLILTAGLLLDTTPATLAALVLALVAVWVVAWWRLRSGYVRELGRNLARMNLDPDQEPVSLRERSILKETVRMLESPYERVALQAIEMLEQNAARLLDARLPKLLAHASPRVRARALERAATSPSPEDRERVAELVRDPDPMVRLMALRVHCALDGARSLAALDEFLASEDRDVRATALACLVEHVTEPELPRVRDQLERLLAKGSAEDRAAVAAALGSCPSPCELDQMLASLLEDQDLEVRRAAHRSAGRVGMREHVPALIRALASSETEQAAREGLLAFGDNVVGTLGDWLSDPKVPIESRRAIPRVLSDLPTQHAVTALFRTRERADVVLSYRIIKALNRIRVSNPDLAFPADMVDEDLEYDVREFLLAERHAGSQPLKRAESEGAGGDMNDRAHAFLALVLRERMAQAFNRVFRRLALIYPPRPMFSAYLGTLSENPRVRGNAVEYIERALTANQRELVLPLLPDAKRPQRLELAEKRYGLGVMTAQESLAALLDGDDPWLRTVALYVVGIDQQRELLEQVEANLESTDARVRETATWAKLAFAAG